MKPRTPYTPQLGRRIARRLRLGATIEEVCGEPGMPAPQTVSKWQRRYPEFRAAVARARAQAGWRGHTFRGDEYSWIVADEIFMRLCEGEPLYRICRDPNMPGYGTVHRWRAAHPEFARLIELGRDIAWEDRGDRLSETRRLPDWLPEHLRTPHRPWSDP